jgi:predicted AAA+ superfamily ATPase
MSEAFQILEKTMLLELVFPTTSAQIPILPNYKKSPRLHWLDTGLVNFIAGVQQEVFSSDIQTAWNGVVAEQIVGQELIVDDFSVLTRRSFWVREAKNSNAEVDYLLPYHGLLLPVEVKSGTGSTLKSLHLYMDLANHDLAIRVWNQPFQMDNLHTSAGKKFRLINVPFYLVSQLNKIIGYYI